jgi:hypothetical protein
MYSRKGGSLDVVCSSERKKSGSTLRPQHSALSVEKVGRRDHGPWTAGWETLKETKWAPLEGRMGALGDVSEWTPSAT